MDLSHNLPGSVRNSVYTVVTTYFLKYLDLRSTDLAKFDASLIRKHRKSAEVCGISSLPNTLISKDFRTVWASR